MRVTLIISSMARGGAERVVSILVNAWAEQGKEVTLLTFDHDQVSAYPIGSEVKYSSLGLNAQSGSFLRGMFRNLRRIWVLRRAIRESQPDVIVSFMNQTNVLTLLATRWLRLPVIIDEQTDPTFYDAGFVWSFLRRLVYPFASSLVCPATGLLNRLQKTTRVAGRVIPNPIQVPDNLPRRCEIESSQTSSHVLISMGRLVPEKQFDLLLSAFASIAGRQPGWSLTIIGGGPLRDQLVDQAAALKLSDRVHFAGEIVDPFPLLRSADLFVLASRFEGFGLALAEAMACGLPAVSFDCPFGPREIIRNGVDGILVAPGDVDTLAAVLHRLMCDAQERARLGARAHEVRDRFGTTKIVWMWQQLFDELSARSPSSGVEVVKEVPGSDVEASVKTSKSTRPDVQV